jgi:exopolyphosphatase/guanosine-5'-triphosphate,3'-diphosphate pyrophosphatase
MRIAVLDLGSTSFRLALVDVDADGSITHRAKKRAALNLGLIVGRKGKIPEPHAAAAVESLARFREQAERFGAERVITVATSALRDASNREALASRFERAVGGPIRFLSGEEEAALTYAALRASLRLGGQTVFGLDLGGGSLELVVGDGTRPLWVRSLALGSARLTGMFVRHDPMLASERESLRLHIRESLLPLAPDVRIRGPESWIAAGGTAKALARLVVGGTGDPELPIHGLEVTRGQLRRICDQVLAMSRSERLRFPGMAQHRVDVIATGALVLSTLVEVMGADALTVSEWGLREGIILEALGLAAAPVARAVDRRELARSR